MTQTEIQVHDDQVRQVEQLIAANFKAAVDELIELVKTPGIAWDAFDANNLELSATQVAKLFEETGVFDFVEIRRSSANGKSGAPAILAKRAAKNSKPTFLLYAHHDVQPPGDESQWKTKPFEPVQKDGRLFGRGAADDKAGIVVHLAAIRGLKTLLADDFDLGITIFIEGEEEAGSPTFRNFLEENRADLAADVIVVADSGNLTTEVPSLTTTLRGLVSVVVEVSTLDHALHSGMYGGAVPDAMLALVKLLASLHDDAGNVAVQGLISGKAAPIDYSDADLRRDAGLLDGVAQIGQGAIFDRIWTKPAITVIGIDGQTVALSSNTLLPSARAKISLRIAPGQDPEQALGLLKQHLLQNVPFGAKLSFGEVELGKPFEADLSKWASQLAKQALTDAWQVPSVDIGIGGSIPFIADLTEVFTEAQILVTGVEDPDSRAHSPNESVHLESLKRAMVAETLLLLGGNVKTLP
jgi:acetylornithine deacetylase/succinyl-diaminopimelate desuccinylase-like protein